MATREQRAALRQEIADRLSRTPLGDRLEAITELAEEYLYSEKYVRDIAKTHNIELAAPSPGRPKGATRPHQTTQAVRQAFTILGMYLRTGATYSSVARELGIGQKKVVDIVKLAKECGVIG